MVGIPVPKSIIFTPTRSPLSAVIISPLGQDKIPTVAGLILLTSTILIFAAIAQLMLFIKNPKRTIWASATLLSLMVIPLVILGIFNINPQDAPHLFLFTVLPTIASEYATGTTIILSLLFQWLTIALINLQMSKQLKKAGESETKALFAK